MSDAPRPPPSVPPPPGRWLCPKCQGRMASTGIGCPSVCAAQHSWRHRVCDGCAYTAIEASMAKALSETELEKRVTATFPEPVPCGVGGCTTPWSYTDMLKCGYPAEAERVQQVFLLAALTAMEDVQHCPACGVGGIVPSNTCADVTCGSKDCGLRWCAKCMKNAHSGACGTVDGQLSAAPEKYITCELPQVHLSAPGDLRSKHIRHNFNVPSGSVFILSDVLYPYECSHIIDMAEKKSFQSLEKLFPNDYRSNDRLLWKSHDMAIFLFDRIVQDLAAADLRHQPMGPTGSGMWLPYGINEMIKIARYRPSCVFKAHRDGPWCPSMDEMSLYTLVVYLNGEGSDRKFTGGETRFLSDDAEAKVVASVVPRTGCALLFSQHLPHEGASIMSGVKYILRTEVMFRRVRSVLDPTPAFLAACEDLKQIAAAYEASCKAIDTDKEKFLAEYLRAIELQAKPKPASDTLPFPDDVALAILMYLSDRDTLVKFGRLSRRCYRLSRDNGLWRARMHFRFPEVAPRGPQDLSVNWLQRHRGEVLNRKPSVGQPTAIDIGHCLIKTAAFRVAGRTGLVVSCASSWFSSREETYYSHGSRTSYTVYKQEKWDPRTDTQVRPQGQCMLGAGGVPNSRLLPALHESTALKDVGGVPRRWTFVVPDDWRETYLLQLINNDLFRFCALPRFVTASAAVAKFHGVASAVVLHLGHSSHRLTVLSDYFVVRTVRLLNVAPSSAVATRLAKLIHGMLLESHNGGGVSAEVKALDKQVASVVEEAKHLNGDLAQRFVDQVKASVDKVHATDPMSAEAARLAVNYELLMSGGRCSPGYWENLQADLGAALRGLAPQWKIRVSGAPLEDTVRGAASFDWTSPAVFAYGAVQPCVELTAVDVSDNASLRQPPQPPRPAPNVSPKAPPAPPDVTKAPSVPAPDPAKTKFTYAELRAHPAHLPRASLHLYLSDEEFAKVFGMTLREFERMPTWKRDKARQAKGLN